jgi:hypothetical protein
VRTLLKIVGVGVAVFMALAITQEWPYFSATWFGSAGSTPPPLDEEQQRAAVGGLRSYLALMSHLYASDGDQRFAERMPASPEVVGEMMADIVYLRHSGRYQELILHGLEVLEVTPLSSDQVEIRTKEHWTIRTLSLGDDSEADPARGQIVFTKYRLELAVATWQVVAWQRMQLPAEEPSAAISSHGD